ncbi:hypothetical protein [Pseudomonas sp. RW3S2]|uniref:hypothetical protein n=1 Tax=Pseudomonas sp. RW3S2 TaxID=485884 RepID=UPI001EE32C22|nr:hypothetical protein [Pseudomonas sp. RW3S2]
MAMGPMTVDEENDQGQAGGSQGLGQAWRKGGGVKEQGHRQRIAQVVHQGDTNELSRLQALAVVPCKAAAAGKQETGQRADCRANDTAQQGLSQLQGKHEHKLVYEGRQHARTEVASQGWHDGRRGKDRGIGHAAMLGSTPVNRTSLQITFMSHPFRQALNEKDVAKTALLMPVKHCMRSFTKPRMRSTRVRSRIWADQTSGHG